MNRKFTERYRGENAIDAFKTGSRVSRDVHGMGKGNLCDKSSFRVITPIGPVILDEDVWNHQLPAWVGDPWGPAACVDLGGGNFVFFGVSPVT